MDSLPSLPRVIRKKEASITPKVLTWFRENHKGSCAIEIKVAKGNSLPASALAPHQHAALMAASRGGIVHKLSDEARRRQPFDAFMLQGVPAYVVVVFTAKRIALAIPVAHFPLEGSIGWGYIPSITIPL